METGLLHLHSFLRWVGLFLMLVTIVDSLVRIYRPFLNNERKLSLFTMIILHTQLLIGIALYFVNDWHLQLADFGSIMKNPVSRFYLVEHFLGMVIAIALVTIGHVKAKKQSESWAKHKLIFTYYTIALILILISIPWPFRMVGEGRGWF
jgi:Ni,Fe-hydrogenase I cytochrome b subunit